MAAATGRSSRARPASSRSPRDVPIRSLATGRRAVFGLAPDLLLVFKPRGHAEPPHAHPHGQVLRVLRGRLLFERGGKKRRLGPSSPAYRVRAGAEHATLALEDTWLAVERKPRRSRSASGRSS